ncbi:MAG: hypothetical protein LBM98_09730, partial [Oscillospiraceae bacterium]|nr:hypothetical protein [Oscillospiraceae bacterium]
MKKLTAVLLCRALLMSLTACAKAPAESEVDATATPTVNSLFPRASPAPSPPPKQASNVKREMTNVDGNPVLYIGLFSSGSFEIE